MGPTMTSERKNYRRGLEQEGCKMHVQSMCDTVPVERKLTITRAPLGYFYNAPHWGGGYFEPPPSDLRNYWTDSKNSSGI